MSFDTDGLYGMFRSYIEDCVEFSIQIGVTNADSPTGEDHGRYIGVGEVHGFDLFFVNNGPLEMRNVIVQVSANRGQLSQDYRGINASFAGSHWGGDWHDTIAVRPFNLRPGERYRHRHETSTGPLFGFNPTETTAGGDGQWEKEELITAKIILWTPHFDQKEAISDVNGPTATYVNHIQED